MKVLLIAAVLIALAAARPDPGHPEVHEHKHATSYQNFNLESFHPVPVYKKHEEHEHSHRLEASPEEGHGEEGIAAYHASLSEGGENESFAHLGAAAVSEESESGYSGHAY